ncbi:MAG: hypothetical protein L6Q78_09970, partial [Bacteroidia bacterium]|nr:hypothetical protein [Bacteroidia bacterium]
MRSAIFSLVCCFLWIGVKAQGQGKLINLGTEAEPVSIQVQSSTVGVLDCEGGLKGFGFRNCKEILAAFSLPERWIIQVQGRKLLVGKLPLGGKFASGMFLIPAELASSLVKCTCQNQVLYSIQGLDCESGCKALNKDTSIQAANGAGTRSAIPSTRNKPGLRREGVPQPEPYETTEINGQQTGAERADTNSVNGLRVPPSIRGVVIDKKLFRKDKKGFVQPVSSPGNASGVAGLGEDLTDTLVQEGNGAGNRSAIPSTRNKPGLRSDAPPTPGKEQSTSAQGQTSGQEKGISNQSNQNKPRAEVKTLGDLVSYRTGVDSSQDTIQAKPSFIGLEQEGIHTSTYNSKQNNPKPKQETTTLGEISALAALKTGQTGSAKDTSQVEVSAKGGGKGG